ncbi:hypothetical protein JOB18_048376 [Solea senegalensis]|uniref:Uncharacterized protein n=1 Tax=Solea senegalensis TaxID=28829 RepID=A0AAV6RLG5_SOLSE|nr:hypothetical protein JOB18_048376 [Solea senegalensis]
MSSFDPDIRFCFANNDEVKSLSVRFLSSAPASVVERFLFSIAVEFDHSPSDILAKHNSRGSSVVVKPPGNRFGWKSWDHVDECQHQLRVTCLCSWERQSPRMEGNCLP